MSEENANKGSDEQVTLSQAEFDALNAKAAIGEEVTNRATELEYEDHNQYLNESEFALYEMYKKRGEKSGPQSPGAGDTPRAGEKKEITPPAKNENMKAFEEQLSANSNLAGTAMVEAQLTTFKLDQRDLPEDQRSPYKEAEMRKIIMDPANQMLIRQCAQKTGGNVWAAASRVMAVEAGDSKAVEAGARAEKARQEAKATADIKAGKSVPVGAGKKTEDEEMDEFAQSIAPDTAPVE